MLAVSRPVFSSLACLVLISIATTFFHLQPWGFGNWLSAPILPSSLKNYLYPDRGDAIWLIAVMSPAQAQRRRDIMRSTWQKMYADPRYEYRFVIASYEKSWENLIRNENSTHGDLICLSHIPEDAHTANTIKSIEFIKYISTNAARRQPQYKYVSKIDDDTFPVLPLYNQEFMNERLRRTPKRSIVGRPMHHLVPWDYPSGRFYTLSWDLIELLSSLHAANPIQDEDEDRLIGRLFYEANVTVVVWGKFYYPRAFDIGWEGWIDNNTLLVHAIKTDERYVEVASLFNEKGYNGKYFNGLTDFNRSFPEVIDKKGPPGPGE